MLIRIQILTQFLLKIENNFFESISVNAETDEQQRLRFQVELEFIQCLANPNYLHCEYRVHQLFIVGQALD